MKKISIPVLSLFFLFLPVTFLAQVLSCPGPMAPINPGRLPQFGKDVPIYNIPEHNQRSEAVCSGPNGSLYAAIVYDTNDCNAYAILQSTDNGLTWSKLYCSYVEDPGLVFQNIQIAAIYDSTCGSLIYIGVDYYEKLFNRYCILIRRYQATPFQYLGPVVSYCDTPFHDFAIACDTSTNLPDPKSIGVLYSTTGVRDSLIIYSIAGNGLVAKSRQVIATSKKRIHKVGLAYGRSATQNKGKYFAVWEEDADQTAVSGNIFTAHSESDYNSKFTKPINLTATDPSLANLCRNPVIACQSGDFDNDSANLTEVVLFEKYDSVSENYGITGFYNKKAATGTSFSRLDIAGTEAQKVQPDIIYNPYDSSFVITYFDSTHKKLPLYRNDFNLNEPDSWECITSAYNDGELFSPPNPKVQLNTSVKSVVTTWTSKRESGKGVAMFDAPYFPPIGIFDPETSNTELTINVWPNPCKTTLNLSFEQKKAGRVTVSVTNILGQSSKILMDRYFVPGPHTVQFDVSGMQAGTYFYTLRCGNSFQNGKFFIAK